MSLFGSSNPKPASGLIYRIWFVKNDIDTIFKAHTMFTFSLSKHWLVSVLCYNQISSVIITPSTATINNLSPLFKRILVILSRQTKRIDHIVQKYSQTRLNCTRLSHILLKRNKPGLPFFPLFMFVIESRLNWQKKQHYRKKAPTFY